MRERKETKRKKKTLQTKSQGLTAAFFFSFFFFRGVYNHVFSPGVEDEKSPAN